MSGIWEVPQPRGTARRTSVAPLPISESNNLLRQPGISLRVVQFDSEVSRMSGKAFWIVFGAGAAIGAAVALLYAPQTGVVARKKLRHGIEDAEEYLEDAGDYLKEQAERLSKEAQKALKMT